MFSPPVLMSKYSFVLSIQWSTTCLVLRQVVRNPSIAWKHPRVQSKYMTYINPKDKYAPRHRRDVADFARRKGVRVASRYYGIHPGAISKWMKKANTIGYHPIPTKSSRPHHHPLELKDDVVKRIVEIRIETRRTYEVIHKHLENEGIKTSPSSVLRTLDRRGLLKKRSPLKLRWTSGLVQHEKQKVNYITNTLGLKTTFVVFSKR